jgi:hypothetical protein
VLAVLLVLLIASAAAYSVFLRPLHDLVLNSGALVLGVWGIRSILTPANLYYLTAIDLALSIVIIFTLGAITVRRSCTSTTKPAWSSSGVGVPSASPPMIEVRVPATSANLGPGFDVLGLALGLYNDIAYEEAEGRGRGHRRRGGGEARHGGRQTWWRAPRTWSMRPRGGGSRARPSAA